tara:strand:- start:4527 stop:4916 length:390 start_codon:yes stop_codon:yes gene_type:complete
VQRRSFIRSLLGIPALIPLTTLAEIPPHASLKIQESPVAGFQYYSGERLWGLMRLGDLLELQRESSNPYDDRAVVLFWDSYKIGYVPRRDNAAIAQMLDRDVPLQASITKLGDSNDPWDRVKINVRLIS